MGKRNAQVAPPPPSGFAGQNADTVDDAFCKAPAAVPKPTISFKLNTAPTRNSFYVPPPGHPHGGGPGTASKSAPPPPPPPPLPEFSKSSAPAPVSAAPLCLAMPRIELPSPAAAAQALAAAAEVDMRNSLSPHPPAHRHPHHLGMVGGVPVPVHPQPLYTSSPVVTLSKAAPVHAGVAQTLPLPPQPHGSTTASSSSTSRQPKQQEQQEQQQQQVAGRNLPRRHAAKSGGAKMPNNHSPHQQQQPPPSSREDRRKVDDRDRYDDRNKHRNNSSGRRDHHRDDGGRNRTIPNRNRTMDRRRSSRSRHRRDSPRGSRSRERQRAREKSDADADAHRHWQNPKKRSRSRAQSRSKKSNARSKKSKSSSPSSKKSSSSNSSTASSSSSGNAAKSKAAASTKKKSPNDEPDAKRTTRNKKDEDEGERARMESLAAESWESAKSSTVSSVKSSKSSASKASSSSSSKSSSAAGSKKKGGVIEASDKSKRKSKKGEKKKKSDDRGLAILTPSSKGSRRTKIKGKITEPSSSPSVVSIESTVSSEDEDTANTDEESSKGSVKPSTPIDLTEELLETGRSTPRPPGPSPTVTDERRPLRRPRKPLNQHTVIQLSKEDFNKKVTGKPLFVQPPLTDPFAIYESIEKAPMLSNWVTKRPPSQFEYNQIDLDYLNDCCEKLCSPGVTPRVVLPPVRFGPICMDFIRSGCHNQLCANMHAQKGSLELAEWEDFYRSIDCRFGNKCPHRKVHASRRGVPNATPLCHYRHRSPPSRDGTIQSDNGSDTEEADEVIIESENEEEKKEVKKNSAIKNNISKDATPRGGKNDKSVKKVEEGKNDTTKAKKTSLNGNGDATRRSKQSKSGTNRAESGTNRAETGTGNGKGKGKGGKGKGKGGKDDKRSYAKNTKKNDDDSEGAIIVGSEPEC